MTRKPARVRHIQNGRWHALPAAVFLIAMISTANAQDAAEPDPAWRASALALVPPGYVAGRAYRTDDPALTGYLAVHPASANDPKSPLSAFATRETLFVRLTKGDGGLRALSAELKPRDSNDPDDDGDGFAKTSAELAQKRAALPPGTEPCDLGAWSEDHDPKGLNVRAEPSAKARILGTLPQPYRLK
ncbi:MAG: hypothetical protein K2X57_19060, partial [Xanthobacteraceae bacterium]|nr:hypothetical protein [Xanthobacteraceae bacterium]